MGFGVMPMAVALNVQCIVQIIPNSCELIIENVTSDKYPPHSQSIHSLDIDRSQKLHWYHYFLCGFRSAVEWKGEGV